MPGTIAVAIPRKRYGETSFGERLHSFRKARGLTQVNLDQAAGTTQRIISYYRTEAGFSPSPAVIDLADALSVTTNELLGIRSPRVERINENREVRRIWKKFQRVATLPERSRSHHPTR